jgi:uncharacterized protein (DUF2141 family)
MVHFIHVAWGWRHGMKKVFASIAMGWALLCASGAFAGEVRITFVGVEDAKGTVRAALFDSEEAYEADRRTAVQMTPAVVESVEIVFRNVSPGTYGVASFQDVNGNEELDRNFVGRPTEPYGHSNNARGRFGPPSFGEISFQVGTEPTSLEIRLR